MTTTAARPDATTLCTVRLGPQLQAVLPEKDEAAIRDAHAKAVGAVTRACAGCAPAARTRAPRSDKTEQPWKKAAHHTGLPEPRADAQKVGERL